MIFISRAGADAEFAAEIGGILESAGHSVILQQWDFANRNFMERMHDALARDARVVALLSPEYLRSEHCQAEWQNAIADDPLNARSRLILLRVAECEPRGLLSGLAYWDLVPVRDNRTLLEGIVLDAVREDRRDAMASGPYWRAPSSIVDAEAIRPVSSFSGRAAELAALDAALAYDGGVAAVHGLGGVGKSSIAREYAWRNRERYSVVWWLGAQSEDGIVEGLLRLGALFVRGLDTLADRRAAAQQVIGSVLSGFSKPVLLIFDNLEEEQLLWRWLPRSGSRALVTARNAAWGAGIASIRLPAWHTETASGYLRRESGRTDLSEDDARAIAEALGALPLALSHAAASLRGMRMLPPSRYLEHVGQHLKNAPRGAEYPGSVFATFSTAIAQAEREAPGTTSVLCFAACFSPDAIPDELFRQSTDLYPEGFPADVSLDEALGALDRLSLLSFAETPRTYSIHRLVQLVARDAIAGATLGWCECAVAAAGAIFPDEEFAAWPRCERLLLHARAALDALPAETAFLPAGRLARQCAVYLWKRGEYAAAESLHVRAIAILERALGSNHVDVSRSLNNLAVVYWEEGRYQDAAALLERVVSICEASSGPEHLDVARSLNNLASAYGAQGRYAAAEPLFARALGISEKALGPEHWEVAHNVNNLAIVCRELERYEEADALFARATALRESALGVDHPDFADSLSNRAVLYRMQGRHEESAALHRRALEIREKALGADHPYVAQSLHFLATAQSDRGGHDEALPLFTRALEIREKTLGPNHPDVAVTLAGLAEVHKRQGRRSDAAALLSRVLAIRVKALGADHPLTTAVRGELESLDA